MPPLWNHQLRLLEKNPNRVLAVHGLGSGKTRTAIEWAKKKEGGALIVCPKGLKLNWQRECIRWGLEGFTILSKEEFKKYVKDYKHKVLIVDEADHFFSAQFKSALSKALRWYIKTNNPALFMATGTPYRSSAWNIYTAATFLGCKWDYMKFKHEFFTEIRMGYRMIPVPKAGTEYKMRALIEKISDVFKVEEAFDIPEQRDEVIESGESKTQELLHKKNQEVQPIVRFTRDHQIEAGTGCLDEGTDNKLALLLEYAWNEPKIVVVMRYREQLEKYAQRLRKEGYTTLELHGDVKNRQEVIDKAEILKECIVLIQSATCEGYELPSFSVMIFASMDFSYRNLVQIKGRMLRMNRLHKNVFVYLLAGKCDKAIWEAMEGKRDFDVLAYMKETNA